MGDHAVGKHVGLVVHQAVCSFAPKAPRKSAHMFLWYVKLNHSPFIFTLFSRQPAAHSAAGGPPTTTTSYTTGGLATCLDRESLDR